MVAFNLLAVATLAMGGTVAQQQIRYMPMGDSITEATCWRSKLWHKLQSTEFAKTKFVGSRNGDSGSCNDNTYDKHNEGHSGYMASKIATEKLAGPWLSANPADVVSIFLGTNDLAYNHKVDDIIPNFTTILTAIRAANAKMKIVLVQIIPLDKGQSDRDKKTTPVFNTALASWAKTNNKTESPIFVADCYSGMNASDYRDALHPNEAGDVKIANNMYPAMLLALSAARSSR